MKVILLKDIPNLGKRGDVKEVKPGYAVNFLLPKKFVIKATPDKIIEFKRIKEKQEAKRKELIKKINGLVKKLNKKIIKLKAKTTQKNTLYSAISSKEIEKKLREEIIDKEIPFEVELKEKIKSLGEYKVNIKFIEGIKCEIKLKVLEE